MYKPRDSERSSGRIDPSAIICTGSVSDLVDNRPMYEKFGFQADREEFLKSKTQNQGDDPRTPLVFNIHDCLRMDDFVKACHTWNNCACEVPITDISFSPSDFRNWKAPTGTKPLRLFRPFGPKWCRIFTSYLDICPPEIRNKISAVLLSNVKTRRPCEKCLIDHLKEISLTALRLNISDGPGWWSFLCDIHVLGGYDTVLNRVDVLATYERDSQEIRGSDNQRLRDKIASTCQAFVGVKANRQPTFAQFIRFRDSWALPGASTHGEPAQVRIRGKNRRVRGKFANTLSMTDEELVSLAKTEGPAVIYPFRKMDEPVKTRVVQSYDLPAYLRCSYADSLIQNYNGNKVWTTMGMRPEARAMARSRLMGFLKTKGYYAVSLDQSAFDEHQRKSLVRFTLASIWRRVIELADPSLTEELEQLAAIDLDSFDSARVCRKIGGRSEFVCEWKQGVPSGHKWTALIDSLINKAESEVVAEDLELDLVSGLWQGDDAILLVRGNNPVSPSSLGAAFESYGLSVNVAKTWVSDVRFEFLHEIHGPEGAWGFPARVAKSILWDKPNSGAASQYASPHQLHIQLWDTLLKAARRGFNVYDIHKKDVVKCLEKSGVKHAHVKAAEYLASPIALGGGGYGSNGRTAGSWSSPQLLFNPVQISSKLGLQGKSDPSVYRRAALRRLGLQMSLPAISAKFTVHTIRPAATLSPKTDILGAIPRCDWLVSDFKQKKVDAWDKKLKLEDCFASNVKITPDLCPNPVLLTANMGLDKACRLINKWSDHSINLSNSFSSAEPFRPQQQWADRIWASIVAHTALMLKSGSFLKEEAERLAYAGFKMASRIPAGMRVAV